jgi:hypothetical protein
VLDDGRLATRTAETLLYQMQHHPPSPIDLLYNESDFILSEKIASRHVADFRDEMLTETKRRNIAIIAARKAAVRASFGAKIARTEELLKGTHDERIARMRIGQIKNLQARLDAKLSELDKGANVSVYSVLVAGGRLRIVPSEGSQPAQ